MKNRHEKEKNTQLEALHYIKKAKSGTAKLVVAYALLNLSHVSVLCTEWGRDPVGNKMRVCN